MTTNVFRPQYVDWIKYHHLDLGDLRWILCQSSIWENTIRMSVNQRLFYIGLSLSIQKDDVYIQVQVEKSSQTDIKISCEFAGRCRIPDSVYCD